MFPLNTTEWEFKKYFYATLTKENTVAEVIFSRMCLEDMDVLVFPVLLKEGIPEEMLKQPATQQPPNTQSLLPWRQNVNIHLQSTE